MSFQWLEMRIGEEHERRRREAEIMERLPQALEELHAGMTLCMQAYTAAFGPESAEAQLLDGKIRVVVREQLEGEWHDRTEFEITTIPALPGFQVERPGDPLMIEVGLLPGSKVYYRDRELDQYLTEEELTRRVLDRALFPKLGE